MQKRAVRARPFDRPNIHNHTKPKERIAMAVNNRQIAENILAAVGGRENITSVTHCMTRLRFNLKDMGLPDQEQIKKLNGVLGVVV